MKSSCYNTKQLLVAVNDSCKVTLDNGKEKEICELNKQNFGLFKDALISGTMHNFSSDCVLIVLADNIIILMIILLTMMHFWRW